MRIEKENLTERSDEQQQASVSIAWILQTKETDDALTKVERGIWDYFSFEFLIKSHHPCRRGGVY
jgi:hypothetical protein